MAPARGWPFLVGAGRHRDYSVLQAPDFLVAEATHGQLGDLATPTPPDGEPRVLETTTRTGHRLAIVYTTHLVTTADVPRPRDEHSRPVKFMYGFVCPDGRIETAASADLDAAFATALGTYRRFLADEDHFTTATSTAYLLHSTIATWPARDIRTRADTRRPRRRDMLAWSAAAAAVCALLTAVLLTAGRGNEPAPNDPPTPSPSRTLISPSPRPTVGA